MVGVFKYKALRVFKYQQLGWNLLPNEIKSSSSLEILRKSLYKYFLESYKVVHHFTIA